MNEKNAVFRAFTAVSSQQYYTRLLAHFVNYTSVYFSLFFPLLLNILFFYFLKNSNKFVIPERNGVMTTGIIRSFFSLRG
jgi:hypothetical protein